MLNALSVTLDDGNPNGRTRARESFQRQGFVHAGAHVEESAILDLWRHPSQSPGDDHSVTVAEGFTCCVGPLWYHGRFGGAALQLLLGEISASADIDETQLRGNFALFVRTREHCFLMNDALGLVRLYTSADHAFYSTSWLATCAYMGAVELDEDAAVEYVLLGASHSDATVARGVTTLPLGHAFDLQRRQSVPRAHATDWLAARPGASFDEAVESADALLHAAFRAAACAFPGRVRMALSGGFDSRLILAGLLNCGARPELFVYGAPDFEDVPIAQAVAESVDIPLTAIDKAALDAPLAPPGLERLVQNALFFDGLPNDGIYDTGTDQRTRLQQTEGGVLALNGGGGEIFRNYFHLPERAFRPVDIVRAFYRGFDRRVFRRSGGLRRYQDRMVASIQHTLGISGGPGPRHGLSRPQVELLYPLFRCHYWMGVNNSVAVRHGQYATPLLDVDTVRFACNLPLAWKNAGRLESALLTRLHRGVASQPSTYGFRFADGPSRHARRKEWATRARPARARPYINAIGRRLHKQCVTPATLHRCRVLLPGAWRLDPILRLAALPDNVALSRAVAVEVAWRELLQ